MKIRKSNVSTLDFLIAERVGFEPTVQFPVHTLSRRARSATPAPLHFESVNILILTLI